MKLSWCSCTETTKTSHLFVVLIFIYNIVILTARELISEYVEVRQYDKGIVIEQLVSVLIIASCVISSFVC